jgi:hypothetical protein
VGLQRKSDLSLGTPGHVGTGGLARPRVENKTESWWTSAIESVTRCLGEAQGAMKLDVKACALTCGLIWRLGLFVLTGWIIAFDGPTGEATFVGRVYRGYAITPTGSLVGGASSRGSIIFWRPVGSNSRSSL